MRLRRPRQKTLGGLIVAGLLFGLHPVAATAGSVSLAWDPNNEADLSGYKVHVGNSSRMYSQTIDVGHVTSYTVSDLSDGQTYYAAVTAYDIFGNESAFSNEVSTTIPEVVEPEPVPVTEPEPVPVAEPAPEPEPGGSITLSAIGYKVKGRQKAKLSWNGSTAINVDIYRNGSQIETSANDGSYTDHINKRGKGTYTYQVCEEGTTTCSNEVIVKKFN